MSRPALEIADLFRAHGAAWRHARAGDLSLAQLMSANGTNCFSCHGSNQVDVSHIFNALKPLFP